MVMVPCRHHLSSWKSGRSPGIHRPGFFYEQSLMFRVAARLRFIEPQLDGYRCQLLLDRHPQRI